MLASRPSLSCPACGRRRGGHDGREKEKAMSSCLDSKRRIEPRRGSHVRERPDHLSSGPCSLPNFALYELTLFPFRLGRCLQPWQNSLMTPLWTTRTTWAQRGPGWRTRSSSMSSNERKRRGLWQSPQTIIVSRLVFVKSENLSLYLESEYVSAFYGECLGYLDRTLFVGCRQTRPSHLRSFPNQCCSRRRCHAGGRGIV